MHLRPTLSIAAMACALVLPASAAIKKVPYPEVKVEVAEAFKPDAAFETMRKKLSDAIARKDAQALFDLVGPTFVWTFQGGSTDQFDMGRDALHNFKVVFGFRPQGADADGPVENGPFWDALAAFANDGTYYQDTESGNLVCGPTTASAVDDSVMEQAGKKLEAGEETAEWYFTLAPTAVAKAPNDNGPPVARVGVVALPALSVYPPVQEGKPAAPATHLEVLLPNGKTGWVPASAVRPWDSERLCYAKTAKGDWKIAAYDQLE
ncbi:MAG TPA: hypothetical protein VGX95_09110 [Xanthobacteraceae bacterium]|jgi:hypothetical protein|nr:hypothetical protein [Xanthobacteraceae bacterium]